MKAANFRYIQWPVYQDAKKFVVLCHDIATKIPREYRFEFSNQIIRSSLSVALNIAEGSGKQTSRDFNRYLNIARGSLFESIASLDILKELKLVTAVEFTEAIALGTGISNQISGMKSKLSHSYFS